MRSVIAKGQEVGHDYRSGEERQVEVEAAQRPIQRLREKLRTIAKAASDRKEYRVLVVDDSVLPRAAARTMLGTAAGLRLVAEASSGSEALQAMGKVKADLILKDVGPAELQRALWSAIRNESPVPRKMIPDVLRRVAEQTPLSHSSGTIALTSREMQILRGVAKGLPTKRLAQQLGLRVPSVETHLHNLFRKLNASNRGEAVSTAMKLGLITLADL